MERVAFIIVSIGLVGALTAPAAAQSAPGAGAASPEKQSQADLVGKQAARANEVRHSGRIVEIADDGSAIVLEEIVAWTGSGTGAITRSIRLTPRTSLRLIERTDTWNGRNDALPGWDARAIRIQDLRKGDFVTVTTDDDRRGIAVALQIIRPDQR
jgi:hypothetical protein